MIKYIITITFFGSSFLALSQEDEKSKITLSKRFSEEKVEKSTTPILPSQKNFSTSNSKTINSAEEENNLSQPIPATRINEKPVLTEVNYMPNSKLSTLDNLLNFIEEKEKINMHGTSLIGSADYKKLIGNIDTYKSDFNNYVESKGIENCTIQERNHYLAFLKEDGNETKYLENVSKLK